MRAILLTALVLAGCGEAPLELIEGVRVALEKKDLDGIQRRLDPEYADPIGDEQVLLADLRELFEAFPSITLGLSELHVETGPSELSASVSGVVNGELAGTPTWKIDGTVVLELKRSDGWRIRSGLLTELRDARRVMAVRRAAFEANDAEAIRPLLHPGYRDGDVDEDEAIRRLSKDLSGVAVRLEPTNYRLEQRGALCHLDEHYILTVGERRLPPGIGRFTLKKSSGRLRIADGLFGPAGEP